EGCRSNLARVRDPALRAALTPDYEVGCKRLIMAEGFYEAIQQPNAHLVTLPIDRFETKGIRTSDGRLHELDLVFLATGFDPHAPYGEARIEGADGLSLATAWEKGAVAYKQVMTAGFPNWFMIGGPGSPIGNFSFLLTAETQMGYIMQLIAMIVAREANAIDVKRSAQEAFNVARLERMKDTVWESGCTTWYRDKNGNVPFWPWNFTKFTSDMAQPDFDHYQIY
ncbi:MAG: NAD(P)/FAD-dependent oxidoreductase, partial [bacterium]|nr:NAD(P)/FAD-dependent oxidoreductase [bacterium]